MNHGAGSLLEDDQQYIDDLRRTSYWGTSSLVRHTFVIMLLSSTLHCPEKVWAETWELLSEDIEYIKRKEFNRPDLVLSDDDRKGFALQDIDYRLRRNGSSLARFETMPKPPRHDCSDEQLSGG